MENTKIAVVGIGGIGGSLAYHLVEKYGDQVTLIARGRRAESLRQKGVVLHSATLGDRSTAPVKHVGEKGADFGVQDVIYVCLKNYSLEEAREQIRPMVSEGTVIVPVMNGIEPGDTLREMFPEAIGVDGLIYCNCTAQEDFSILQRGKYVTTYIGSKIRDDRHVEGAKKAAALLQEAGADVRYSDNIEGEIWKKYILNCAFNCMTARFDQTIGQLRENPERVKEYRQLLEEAYSVAKKEEIPVQSDVVEVQLDSFLHVSSYDSTSSLREDLRAGRRTEVDAFGGALLRRAEKNGLSLPLTKEYHEALLQKIEAQAHA